MSKNDIGSVTAYDIEIYSQSILTAQIKRVQYKYIYLYFKSFEPHNSKDTFDWIQSRSLITSLLF